ncbi:AraC family transcriptional activator of pobA [Siphonobacter sp. SORGH_AS 1065]|nr:AraC family transcriptional activator of pobA [Siphonobacter sp. SORGH_AS_1065]
MKLMEKRIEQLEDIPSVTLVDVENPDARLLAITPVARNYFENWNIRVVNREEIDCKNYLSPNRRDFYKITFFTQGTGLFSQGMHRFCIEEPTMVFIHPNEIISWKNVSSASARSAGYYCLFKKRYVDAHPTLKTVMDRYKLFTERKVVRLSESSVATIDHWFREMAEQAQTEGTLVEDTLQAYLQLIMIESMKGDSLPLMGNVSDDYRHVHDFFQLLEEEAATINLNHPVRLRTAKEFAEELQLHPNYLNALLKKHTGQNISTHIKNRLLEESKALLLQTDWTLQQIGYCIGFADQPNFSQFFKKNTGLTPAVFRRSHQF